MLLRKIVVKDRMIDSTTSVFSTPKATTTCDHNGHPSATVASNPRNPTATMAAAASGQQ